MTPTLLLLSLVGAQAADAPGPATPPELRMLAEFQDDLDDLDEEEDDGLGTQVIEKKERKVDMEVGFRGRYLFLPDGIMDIWFYNETEPGYAYDEPRPTIEGYAIGLEYVVKSKADAPTAANGIFYFQYIDSEMGEGYWDDVEGDAAVNHLDGDYLVPSQNLGLIAFGADYAFEVFFVRPDQTNRKFAMSLLAGAGLGVAYLFGDITQWNPCAEDCGGYGNTAFERYNNDAPDDGTKRLPSRVWPLLDFNVGLRFVIAERVVLRFEGGLNDLIYGGGALSVQF